MRLVPIIPAARPEFEYSLRRYNWSQLGGYGNAWQIGAVRVINTVGDGWDHVSVSCENRCPSWNEMEFVKRSFFEPHETVMQLHVPEAEHVNFMPYCLHLWRPHFASIPRPPNYLVGGPA